MKHVQKNKMLTAEKRATGFSLVELLVGMVIALITTLAIFQVFSTYQGQKESTTSESDALQSGNLAVYLLSNELRKAGTGISTNRIYKTDPGEITPLYGCQMSIEHADHFENEEKRNEPLPHADVPIKDLSGATTDGSFRGFGVFKTVNEKPPTIPLVPLLIKTAKKGTNKNESEIGADLIQGILISMASTNAMPGMAPICNIKPLPAGGGSALARAESAQAEGSCDVPADEGSLITLGYIGTQSEGGWQAENEAKTPPQWGGYLGFCSTSGLRENDADNRGSMCYETILAISKDFTQCTLTTTGAYKPSDTGAYTSSAHGWQAHLSPTGATSGTMETPLLSLQSQLSKDYAGGYVMSLGRLDHRNVREEQDNQPAMRSENVRRSGFALFTVGKDGQGGTGKSNLLRYDIVQNRMEVLAENIVLIKAIYGLAGTADADGDKRAVAFRNMSDGVWKQPKDGWAFDELTKNTDVARQRLRRIRAVKVALVARNALQEEDPVIDNRSTAKKIKLFEKELGSDAITLNFTGEKARYYRYEVFEFIVPLQNAQYGFDQAYASCSANCD